MPTKRLYLLDATGHIKAREILKASDDCEAVSKAEAYLQEYTAGLVSRSGSATGASKARQQHVAA